MDLVTYIGQLGVGGLFAIILVREVLSFLSKRKNHNVFSSGDYSSEFWQAEMRRAMSEVIVATVTPILANQTMILSEMRAAAATSQRDLSVILDRLTQMAQHR